MRNLEDKYPGGMFPRRELMELERFGEAWQKVRSVLAECEVTGISNEAVMAALFTELLPQLVQQYGPLNGAGVFGRMVSVVAQSQEAAKHVQ